MRILARVHSRRVARGDELVELFGFVILVPWRSCEYLKRYEYVELNAPISDRGGSLDNRRERRMLLILRSAGISEELVQVGC